MTAIVSFYRYYTERARSVSIDTLSARDVIILPNAQKSQLFQQSQSHFADIGTRILPNVISLNQWLTRSYLLANDTTHTPLPAYDQLLYWYEAVKHHASHLTDTQSWQIAQTFQSHYLQPSQNRPVIINELLYQSCLTTYRSAIKEAHMIDHISIADQFSKSPPPNLYQRYVFTGFSELTDLLKAIIDSLPSTSLFCFPPHYEDTKPAQIIADHEQAQRDYVIGLCQDHLNEPTSGPLGLVVPDQGSVDSFQMITEVMCALPQEMTSHKHCLSSTLTTGLTEQPLIQTLSSLLDFLDAPTRDTAIQLLSLPIFHQSDIPSSAYHFFCHTLMNIPLERWQDHPYFSSSAPDPIFRIAQFCTQLLTVVPSRHLYWHEWQVWFRDTMANLIGDYPADSPEDANLYQTWLQTIRDQPCPPSIASPIAYRDWLLATTRCLARTPFRSSDLSRIRILTWSQALDIPHQSLIFLSHHAGTWPPEQSTDLTTDSTQYWDDIFHQLRQSCRQCTFIRLKHDSQQQPLLPAHQTEQLPVIPIPDRQPHPFLTLPDQRIRTQIPVFGKPISADEQRISTAVVDAYSQCAAMGFLSHRLHIRPTQLSPYGLTAADIGTLIHEVLSQIDHITEDNADHSLSDHVQSTLQRHRCSRYLTDGQRVTVSAHLERSLQTWLDYRQSAHSEDTITHCAHEVCIDKTLFGVQFTVRLDRVDYYPDGSCRIIDYKTGITNRAAWLQDPPQSPQLVVYALCQPQTRAIAFASLHPDQLGYSGYGAQSDLSGIKPITDIVLGQTDDSKKVYNTWPTQMALWEKAIGRLITHYREGALHKNPVNGTATCQYCQLQSACRYYEEPVMESAK